MAVQAIAVITPAAGSSNMTATRDVQAVGAWIVDDQHLFVRVKRFVVTFDQGLAGQQALMP
jgi:hypothetical protein